MALWDRWRSREPAPRSIGPLELLDRYDIVGTDGAAIVVAEKPKKLAAPETSPALVEMGSARPGYFGNPNRYEYNRLLAGQQGLQRFDEMRRSDAQVRGTLRLVKTPVLAARWFVDPASDTKQDKKIAEFVNNCFFRYMSCSFPQVLQELLLELDFGHYMLEKVFAFRDGKVVWRKLAPRHPMDVCEWHYDMHGGPNSVDMYGPGVAQPIVNIPIEDLLVFTHEKEGGNMEGLSVLRSAYKHWYYKDNLYKIDAIQKERHGLGVPIIKMPPGFTVEDKRLANEMGENLRTNEKAHIILPPYWEVMTLKIEGQPVDVMQSIEHHDMMIARNVLGQFLNTDGSSSNEEDQQLFLKATRFIADQIRDVFNTWAIPQLVDFNWRTVTEYPELKVRRIGETVDWRTISFAIRNLIGANVIVPDDALEKHFRQEMDLPLADPETAREAEAPQGPGSARVGPPRQSKTGNMRQAKSAGSTGRIGNDQSGGK